MKWPKNRSEVLVSAKVNSFLRKPNSFQPTLFTASSTSPTTPDPGPQFLDSATNHTLVQSPVSSTTFLHCEVKDLS